MLHTHWNDAWVKLFIKYLPVNFKNQKKILPTIINHFMWPTYPMIYWDFASLLIFDHISHLLSSWSCHLQKLRNALLLWAYSKSCQGKLEFPIGWPFSDTFCRLFILLLLSGNNLTFTLLSPAPPQQSGTGQPSHALRLLILPAHFPKFGKNCFSF